MADRRPLPDSEEARERGKSSRLVRWSTGLVVVILLTAAVLAYLWWSSET